MATPTWLELYFNPATPSGTGLVRVTDGKTDPVAALVTDDDVAPGAAIDGAKIRPVFGKLGIYRSSETGGVSMRVAKDVRELALEHETIDTPDTTGPMPRAGDTRVAAGHTTGWMGDGGTLYLEAGESRCDNNGVGGSVNITAGDGPEGRGGIYLHGLITGNSNYNDPLAFGVVKVNVTGLTTITLASWQYCAFTIVFIGTLSGNTDMLFPLDDYGQSQYTKLLVNLTTGAFSLTARTKNLTAGVVLSRTPPGHLVYCDVEQNQGQLILAM